MMEKVGTWTYWFKSPKFNLAFTTNKKNIPKNQMFVIQMQVYKKDGNKDVEIMSSNKKVIYSIKNINKRTACERMLATFDIQRKLHELLNVPFPDKAYKISVNNVIKKHIKKDPSLKGCKMT